MRDVKRPEALNPELSNLLTNPDEILSELSEILDSNNLTHEVKTFQNPYGDGEQAKNHESTSECS